MKRPIARKSRAFLSLAFPPSLAASGDAEAALAAEAVTAKAVTDHIGHLPCPEINHSFLRAGAGGGTAGHRRSAARDHGTLRSSVAKGINRRRSHKSRGAELIDIRPARHGDEAAVQALLGELGYAVAAEEVRSRLDDLLGRGTDPVLLAAAGDEILGLIALHWTRMLHHRERVARITALIVRDRARGKGVGRALVEAGAERARAAGCGLLELTTALHRTDAQAFYKSLGFEASSLRLHRLL